MDRTLQQQAQDKVDYLRARIEDEFPDLKVALEPWDYADKIRGHVSLPGTDARLNFGKTGEGISTSQSKEELADLLLPEVRRWLEEQTSGA